MYGNRYVVKGVVVPVLACPAADPATSSRGSYQGPRARLFIFHVATCAGRAAVLILACHSLLMLMLLLSVFIC